MRNMRVLSMACWTVLICTYSAHAAEFEWIPVSATGTHTINGNTIALVGGGQQVTLELHMSGWVPLFICIAIAIVVRRCWKR